MGHAMWPCAMLLLCLICQTRGQLKFTPVSGGSSPSLRPSTGMVVLPTPPPGPKDLVVVGNGTRYKGSINPDPQNRPDIHGLFEILAQESDVVGVHMIHVPNTDKVLYMERPSEKRATTRQIAGTFDLVSRVWTPVDSSDGLFCSGHTITSEGEVVVGGGHKATGGYADGMRSVRIFSQTQNPKLLVNETWMEWKRWYATLTLLSDSQIMIMGGTQQVGGSSGGNPEYELYQPDSKPNLYPLPFKSVEPTFLKQMKKMYYPFNFVLPTGDVYSFGERQGRIMVAQTGKYRLAADGTYIQGPRLEGTDFTQYPFTASAAYSALTWEDNYSSTTLMIFGGAPVAGVSDFNLLAARNVRSMKISWTKKGSGYAYQFSNWTIEDMGISRVMGYGTLLPNGDVVITCGAQVGVAGDGSTSTGSGGRSDYPNFWAQLYQPDRPVNQRLSLLAGSTIARMYHGTAVLTTNATILVAGCDRCYRLNSDVPGYISPNSRWEYRQEIFYPPYWFDTANKPRITSVNNGQTTLDYNQSFTIQWTGETAGADVPVTSVSLVAPSSATHSFDMNQRVVVLKVLAVDYKTNTMTLNSPPHPYIAPPQYYMIFAMNGKTMSKGLWIKLVDSKGLGKVVPNW